jgi:WD40 repeat protein
MVWDTATGERLHTLRDKNDTMRAIQYLAIDPVDTTVDEVVILSSSSDPKIRRWRISLESADQILEEESSKSSSDPTTIRDAIHEHETSVYKLLFDSDEGDLWTASADGTAKCLSRANMWAAEETFQHGDYVRAIAVTSDWIITAGRDEDVKVWDRSTGKLFHVYDGHFEEVSPFSIITDHTADRPI